MPWWRYRLWHHGLDAGSEFPAGLLQQGGAVFFVLLGQTWDARGISCRKPVSRMTKECFLSRFDHHLMEFHHRDTRNSAKCVGISPVYQSDVVNPVKGSMFFMDEKRCLPFWGCDIWTKPARHSRILGPYVGPGFWRTSGNHLMLGDLPLPSFCTTKDIIYIYIYTYIHMYRTGGFLKWEVPLNHLSSIGVSIINHPFKGVLPF